jgi:hypothetical protein
VQEGGETDCGLKAKSSTRRASADMARADVNRRSRDETAVKQAGNTSQVRC